MSLSSDFFSFFQAENPQPSKKVLSSPLLYLNLIGCNATSGGGSGGAQLVVKDIYIYSLKFRGEIQLDSIIHG